MKISQIPWRTRVLCLVLFSISALWAVSAVQVKLLEAQLAEVAEAKIQELIGTGETGMFEVAEPVITVAREFLIFGKTKGKVAIYMRPVVTGDEQGTEELEEEHAPQSGHHHTGGISGIEYFLEKEKGGWLDTESGQCSSEQCQVEGKKAFLAGLHLP